MTTKTRPIYEIAAEIRRTWKNVNYAAKPYLEGMEYLRTIEDNLGADTGKCIVIYFLNNASTWRGEDARRIKAELNGIVGSK